MNQIPLFDAKNRLTALVRQVENGSSIQLTRHGKAVAVLMGNSDYAALVDKDRSFSACFSRFVLEWPQTETSDPEAAPQGSASPEPEDPFEGIRSDRGGRPVDL